MNMDERGIVEESHLNDTAGCERKGSEKNNS